MTGTDPLAVRASKKLPNDELLITSFAGTRLRLELDKIPLWRGDHVPVRQLVEDFAKHPCLPRLTEPGVLREAIRNGAELLTWEAEAFADAEGFNEGGVPQAGSAAAAHPAERFAPSRERRARRAAGSGGGSVKVRGSCITP